MENKKGTAPKPMLYIVQPAFDVKPGFMQERYIWRKKDEKAEEASILDETTAKSPIQAEETARLRIDEKETGLEENPSPSVREKRLKDTSVPEAAAPDESSGNTKKRIPASGLVNFFLKELRGENQAVAKQEGRKMKTSNLPDTSALDRKPFNRDIWLTVTKLSRYPQFVERPMVRAIVNGEKMEFQISSKRGSNITIKMGEETRMISLEDISEIQVV